VSPGLIIIGLFLLGAVVVGLITLLTMRLVLRRTNMERVVNEGVLLTEIGIEYPRFLYLGKRKTRFSEIRSVELVPYGEVAKSILMLRYGISIRRPPLKPCGDLVVVRLKHPNPIEYLFFGPRDPLELFEQLRRRMGRTSAADAGNEK
jgi:hypothetical protein